MPGARGDADAAPQMPGSPLTIWPPRFFPPIRSARAQIELGGAHRIGIVAAAKLEPIDPELARQLVDRELEREHPCGHPGARIGDDGPALI